MKKNTIVSRRMDRPLATAKPPSTPTQDWPEVPMGTVYTVNQSSLLFGRDHHLPTYRRPVMTLVNRDGWWFVLPGIHEQPFDASDFFHIPSDSPDCLIRDEHRPDQFFYVGYEVIDLVQAGAKDFGLIHQRLRIALGQWLVSHGRCV